MVLVAVMMDACNMLPIDVNVAAELGVKMKSKNAINLSTETKAEKLLRIQKHYVTTGEIFKPDRTWLVMELLHCYQAMGIIPNG
jgi:hypothetical protein